MNPPYLTICYVTARLDCRIEWFLESLHSQIVNTTGIRVVVVDFHLGKREGVWNGMIHVAPKPTVWQGPHRLTKKDYFAPANARNTGLCYAPDGWIAYVDDLSVLMPGWVNCVREAMANNYIALGAYKKVLGLKVKDGHAQYHEFRNGIDSRWPRGADRPIKAAGSWLYGCSLAAPVEAFLKINGWDEACDSLGGEDYIAGIMMERAGYSFRYDRRMLTLESEELHHVGENLTRFDKGKSPKDKSHAILAKVMSGGRVRAENAHLGPGGIRALRESILKGGPFPVPDGPTHDWYDNQPLCDL